MRGLRGRLARLEEATRLPAGHCPHCPPVGPLPYIEVDEDGNVLSGAYPPKCAACGGPHGVIRFIEMVRPRQQDAGRARDDPDASAPEVTDAPGR